LLVFIAASTLGAGFAFNACAPAGGSRSSDEAGGVSVALSVAGGETLSTVTYTITGPMGFSAMGSIDVSQSSTISSTIGGLPAGSPYSITLQGTSTSGRDSCTGHASGFTVTAHTTTQVSVPVQCHETPKTGGVGVTGVLNVCPQIDGVTASPTEVYVGSSLALVATAHDSDGGPSPLSYAWSASSGVLTDATTPATRFTCTAPGVVTINLSVSDGDANCPDATSLTVTCTALTAQHACALGNGAGPIQHVIYLQFDNTHLTRDRPNIPSDLEQMPHLLNFIRGNGTMMANDHTQLISHTSVGFLTSYTGMYPDRTGQTVGNSYARISATGTFSFPSAFGYWNDPVSASDPTLNMVSPDGSAVPAPWVAYTRAGCDFGATAGANIALENTGTGVNGDIYKVFGPGSPQFMEAQSNASAPSGSALRNLTQAEFVGMQIHCAQGSARCAGTDAVVDQLPGEPGGYTGFRSLVGAKAVFPHIGGATWPATGVPPAGTAMIDLLGSPIADVTGNPGFPGFDGMTAQVTLKYVLEMQRAGIPVTFGYISDAHDYHGTAGSQHLTLGPGEQRYEDQLKNYDDAFAAFFTQLAAIGIDKSNTLFIITVDEGDHFVGLHEPTPLGCDGVSIDPMTMQRKYCDYSGTNAIGEVNANIDTLVQHQLPSIYSSFLASGATYNFTVHGDDAPTFYLSKRGVGALGQTDPVTRDFERQIATVHGSVANPYTGATENMMAFMADQTGMKAIHMFTTGDPLRNAQFTFFGNPDYFITDFPSSTCETCVPTTPPTYSWNHGDVQKEIGTTWAGYVGPGVANQPDQMAFTDHTDLKATINALLGLRDSYRIDGRAATEAMTAAAVPPAIAGERAAVEALGQIYKQIDAPFGQFAADMLTVSTKALQGADMGDTIYTSKEASIASLTVTRDALVQQIRAGLDEAQFANQPIDPLLIASWTSQAQTLLNNADALAAAP
jgi:hypothetical protein